MKIGVVGFGNRIAHVYHELSNINEDAFFIPFEKLTLSSSIGQTLAKPPAL